VSVTIRGCPWLRVVSRTTDGPGPVPSSHGAVRRSVTDRRDASLLPLLLLSVLLARKTTLLVPLAKTSPMGCID
jgi:hypothetical protein